MRKKSTLPHDIAHFSVIAFKKNLHGEGFQNNGFTKWKEVNRRKPAHKQYKPKQQQKILVGKASAGFKKTITPARVSFREIKIVSSGKKYAAYHNEGTSKIPKRQFMGESAELTRKTFTHLDREIKKALFK